jgi:hypothetical protein
MISVCAPCATDIFDPLSKEKGYGDMLKWLETELKTKSMQYSMFKVSQGKVVLKLRSLVTSAAGCGALLATGPPLPNKKDRDLQSIVTCMQIYSAGANNFSVGPLPYGCSECRLILQGQEVIIGIELANTTDMGKLISDLLVCTGLTCL